MWWGQVSAIWTKRAGRKIPHITCLVCKVGEEVHQFTLSEICVCLCVQGTSQCLQKKVNLWDFCNTTTSLEEVRLFKKEKRKKLSPESESSAINRRSHYTNTVISRWWTSRGTMSANHPACLVAIFPGIQRCTLSSLQCVCVLPAEGWGYLQTASWDVLYVGSLQLGCVFVLQSWGYLQIASRASRVRLMSRICEARVCMGCMERSNSSQRAISVYMPCERKIQKVGN